jgi:hypothetical protein
VAGTPWHNCSSRTRVATGLPQKHGDADGREGRQERQRIGVGRPRHPHPEGERPEDDGHVTRDDDEPWVPK